MISSSRRGQSFKERKVVRARRARRVVFSLFLFTLYLFFSSSVSTPLRVRSVSMEPAVRAGERVLYSQLLLEAQSRFSGLGNFGIERGDLVVISPPFYRENQHILDFINPFIRFFTLQKIQLSSFSRQPWETSLMVKRVIALPGDTVKMSGYRAYIKAPGQDRFSVEGTTGRLYSPDIPRLPDLWKAGYPMDGSLEEYTLSEDEYFVLSDARGRGSDSFLWGPLEKGRILGKVFFRYWPFQAFSFL